MPLSQSQPVESLPRAMLNTLGEGQRRFVLSVAFRDHRVSASQGASITKQSWALCLRQILFMERVKQSWASCLEQQT